MPRRCRVGAWRFSASMWAGRSPTRCSSRTGGSGMAKVPTAAQQEESVLAAARAVGAGEFSLDRFAHGTTVATNALLERRGARTAYVGNAGFEHLLHLRTADAGTSLPALRASSRAGRRARGLPRRRGAARAGGRARAARSRLAAGARRRGGGGGVPSLLVPRFGARARGGRGAAAAVPRCARRCIARGRAGVPGVRARFDDGG